MSLEMKTHGKTSETLLPGPYEPSDQTRHLARATPFLRILAALLLLLTTGRYLSLKFAHHPHGLSTPSSTNGYGKNPAYLIEAEHGAVASENERCSIIGVDVLKDGGNAVDAAVATTLCTGVVNMFS